MWQFATLKVSNKSTLHLELKYQIGKQVECDQFVRYCLYITSDNALLLDLRLLGT